MNLTQKIADIKSLEPSEMLGLIHHMHVSTIALLWLIDDLKNFDECTWESHFDETIQVERAEEIHRLLITHPLKKIMQRKYLESGAKEFKDCWDRCKIGESFAIFPCEIEGTQ